MTILEEVRGLLAYLRTNDHTVTAANLDTAVIPTIEKVARLLGGDQSGMIAYTDAELLPWIGGVIEGRPTRAGGFLMEFAAAALKADSENYPLLRPVLAAMAQKYPKYRHPMWEVDAPGERPTTARNT